MTKITKKEMIALPDVKEILETKKVDEMDQIQRWTYDYVNKFSKIDRKQGIKNVDTFINNSLIGLIFKQFRQMDRAYRNGYLSLK